MAKDLSVLITGGSGFLGSHIADALTEAGYEVTIFDLKESPYLRSEQKMIIGDVLDSQAVERAMEGKKWVFHLAAFADLDAAQDLPLETVRINVLGTTNVLEAARKHNVSRVIFASTIYVNSRTGSFYRVSKHSCELLLEEYKNRFGLSYTILRFGTLYGPRANKHNSVYKMLKGAVATGEIKVQGSGREMREYIHVYDAAEICVHTLEEKYACQTLILTGHHRIRLSELVDMVNEIMGGNLKIIYGNGEELSHYVQTPYSFIPRVGKKIVMNTYCDLGQSIVALLDEMSCSQPELKIEF